MFFYNTYRSQRIVIQLSLAAATLKIILLQFQPQKKANNASEEFLARLAIEIPELKPTTVEVLVSQVKELIFFKL